MLEVGSGKRFVGDSVEPFVAGDLVLLGSELPHFWSCEDTEASRGGPAEAIVCHFRRNFLGEQLWTAPEFEAARNLLAKSAGGLAISGLVAEEARHRVSQFGNLTSRHRVVALLDLLVLIADGGDNLRPLASETYVPNLTQHNEPRLERVFRYINDRYAEDLSLEAVAKVAAMREFLESRLSNERTN